MAPMEFRPPLELAGRYVRLVPVAREHAGALWQVAGDPMIWRYMRTGLIRSETEMGALIDKLLKLQQAGGDLPFTVVLRAGDRPVGMTRYLDIQRVETTVEVGGTWYGPKFQRTPVNTDCKLTLMRHAFEVEGAHRVQIRTDLRNERSQHAIERLGAVREGVLREHLMMPDGVMRSSVCYSVLASEWPTVRARLEALLERPWLESPSPS